MRSGRFRSQPDLNGLFDCQLSIAWTQEQFCAYSVTQARGIPNPTPPRRETAPTWLKAAVPFQSFPLSGRERRFF